MTDFRPRALRIQGINENNKEVVENSVYSQEFTIGFHIILGIALTCLCWQLLIKPIFMSKSIIANLFWVIVLPITLLATKVLTDSIMSKSSEVFIYLKYITIWLTSLTVIYLTYTNHPNLRYYIIPLLAFVNIIEASLDQLQLLPSEDETKKIESKKDPTNMINGIIGILIAFIFLYQGYKYGIDIKNVGGMNILDYKLDYMIILAYTLWNLHFRSYLLQNTSTFLFFAASLALPIIANIYYPGSWFQVRVLTLFFYISIVLGISKDQSRLLPMYNEQGYIQKPDSESWLSVVQKEDWYKITLIVFIIIFIVLYFYNKIKPASILKF